MKHASLERRNGAAFTARRNPASSREKFTRTNARVWMIDHHRRYNSVSTLVTACLRHFGQNTSHGGALDNGEHWIWGSAIEAFEAANYPEAVEKLRDKQRREQAKASGRTNRATRGNPSAKPTRAARRNLRPNPGLLYVTVSDHAGDTKSVNGAQLAIDVRSFERAMGSTAARWVSPDRDGDLASAKLSKQAVRLSSIDRGATVYVRGKHIEGTAPRWHRVTVL